MYESDLDTALCGPLQAFGLPDFLFEMHPCGVHICYPKKMGELEFVQTVEDNMKLLSKRQIAGAARARDLHEKLIYPSTSDFRSIVSVGGVPGSDVTTEDDKAADEIWALSVLKTKGNIAMRNMNL